MKKPPRSPNSQGLCSRLVGSPTMGRIASRNASQHLSQRSWLLSGTPLQILPQRLFPLRSRILNTRMRRPHPQYFRCFDIKTSFPRLYGKHIFFAQNVQFVVALAACNESEKPKDEIEERSGEDIGKNQQKKNEREHARTTDAIFKMRET